MRIQLDETNLLASMAGEAHGLTSAEIKDYTPKALEALRGFKALVEKGTVGFPHLPFQDQVAREILDYAGEKHGSYDTVCLVGIGGSALGAWAIDCALRGPHPLQPPFSRRNPRLVVLDNIDPSFVEAALDSMDPKKTLVLAIAKSGSTAETAGTFLIVRHWLMRKLGRKAGSRIAAVTTAGKGDLAVLAKREGYRTFAIPVNVGGRFSVLSPVGLLPAALTGANIGKLMRGAASYTHWCWQPNLKTNLALRAALLHYLIWVLRKKSIHVAFTYSTRLWGAAFWFRQLWAESLGKAKARDGVAINAGQTPVAALGVTDQHSQVQLYIEGPNDKVFTFWAVEKNVAGGIPKGRLDLEAFDYLGGKKLLDLLEAERRSTAAALAGAGRPNCTITLERMDEDHLGAFFQLLEFQTAFMGELLNINAFDQEGVELGKRFTYALMGRTGYDEYRKRFAEYEMRRK